MCKLQTRLSLCLLNIAGGDTGTHDPHHDPPDHNGIATLTLRNAKKPNIVGTPAILELTAAIDAVKQPDWPADQCTNSFIVRQKGDQSLAWHAQ